MHTHFIGTLFTILIINNFVVVAAPAIPNDSIQGTVISNQKIGSFQSFERRGAYRPYGRRGLDAPLERRGAYRPYGRRGLDAPLERRGAYRPYGRRGLDIPLQRGE